MMRIRKAVFPAAGLGTRFLPATKAQPKEMLALVDKPLIQYVVEEAVESGVKNIIIITGRGKDAGVDHRNVRSAQKPDLFLWSDSGNAGGWLRRAGLSCAGRRGKTAGGRSSVESRNHRALCPDAADFQHSRKHPAWCRRRDSA